jgi:N-acetylglucosamine-6-sulfatase
MRRWGALCLVLLALAYLPAEGPATGAEPAASTSLNIVMVMADDQRFDAVAKMPFVNGRSDWVRFSRAVWNNPLCCPSRASILTGLYSHHTHVDDNDEGDLFDETSTLATWLHDGGYKTGFFGKYVNGYPFAPAPYIPAGWDRWVSFDHQPSLYDYDLVDQTSVEHHGSKAGDYSSDVFAKRAVSFVMNTPNDQPFFLMLVPFSPHEPAIAAPRHAGSFQTAAVPKTPDFNEPDMGDKPAFARSKPPQSENTMNLQRRNAWAGALAVDDAVRDLYGALQAKGLLNRTVFIYTSDNGHANGEHRHHGKRCEWDICLRVPFLVRYPGVPGRTDNRMISNIDIAPTITEIANVARPPTDGVSARSAIVGETTASVRDEVLIRGVAGEGFDASYWGVRTATWKYNEIVGTGERELYSLASDPYELKNLAGTEVNAAKLLELATRTYELSDGLSSLPDVAPPTTPPTIGLASRTDTKIRVTWPASSDDVKVFNYVVYRNGVRIGTSTVASYTDATVKPATTYQYAVRAVDTGGNASASSPPLQVRTYRLCTTGGCVS